MCSCVVLSYYTPGTFYYAEEEKSCTQNFCRNKCQNRWRWEIRFNKLCTVFFYNTKLCVTKYINNIEYIYLPTQNTYLIYTYIYWTYLQNIYKLYYTVKFYEWDTHGTTSLPPFSLSPHPSLLLSLSLLLLLYFSPFSLFLYQPLSYHSFSLFLSMTSLFSSLSVPPSFNLFPNFPLLYQ